MIEKIEYSYPLDYEDVLQFIPMLTLDNNVKTDGRILHLEISYFKKLLHLFIDTRTKEYCFNTNIEDESNVLYEIGDMVLSKYRYFKDDFQELIKYIQKNLTACEVLKKENFKMLEIGIMSKHNISKLSDILEKEKSVEFKYNNLFYEIFKSCDTGYMVNLYSSNEKDEDGCFLAENIIDGGLCTGSPSNAVWFMV